MPGKMVQSYLPQSVVITISFKTPTTRQYVVLAAKSVGKQTVNKQDMCLKRAILRLLL